MKKISCYTTVPVDSWVYCKDHIALSILIYICDHINRSGRDYAFPSYSKMKEDLGIARATISKKISLLENSGLLEVDRGNRVFSNKYRPVYRDRIASSRNELASSRNELASSRDELASSPGVPRVVHQVNCNNNHKNNNHSNNNHKNNNHSRSKEVKEGLYRRRNRSRKRPTLEEKEIKL